MIILTHFRLFQTRSNWSKPKQKSIFIPPHCFPSTFSIVKHQKENNQNNSEANEKTCEESLATTLRCEMPFATVFHGFGFIFPLFPPPSFSFSKDVLTYYSTFRKTFDTVKDHHDRPSAQNYKPRNRDRTPSPQPRKKIALSDSTVHSTARATLFRGICKTGYERPVLHVLYLLYCISVHSAPKCSFKYSQFQSQSLALFFLDWKKQTNEKIQIKVLEVTLNLRWLMTLMMFVFFKK